MRHIYTTDTEENMCDECLNHFATCKSTVKFGNGAGNDNVISCDAFIGPDTPCMKVGKISSRRWMVDEKITETNLRDLVSFTEASIPAMKAKWSKDFKEGYDAAMNGETRRTHRARRRGMWFRGYDKAQADRKRRTKR